MKRILYISFVFTLVFSTGNVIWACSCVQPPIVTDEDFKKAVSEGFNDATTVFEGTFTGNGDLPIVVEGRDGNIQATAVVSRFTAGKWWKGNPEKEAILYTSVVKYPNGVTLRGTCDYDFKVGTKYLVYALGPVNKLVTGICARTNVMENADWDLKVLAGLQVKEPGCEEPFYTLQEVSQPAKLLIRPRPAATEEYRRNYPVFERGIKPSDRGQAIVSAVLCKTGKVTNVHIVKPLPYGMNERLIEAVRGIEFNPAIKDGQPVSQRQRFEFSITIY